MFEESQLSKLVRELKTLKKEFNQSKKGTEKKFDKITKILESQEKDLSDFGKRIAANESAIKELNRKTDHELKDIKKLHADLARVERDIRNAKTTINRINRSFNTETLERLKQELTIATDNISELLERNFDFVKQLSKIDKRFGEVQNVLGRAEGLANSTAKAMTNLSQFTDELKGTAEEYAQRADLLHSKFNALASSVADLTDHTKALASQIDRINHKLALIDGLKTQLDSLSALTADLKRRADYLDKVCAKTIVLE